MTAFLAFCGGFILWSSQPMFAEYEQTSTSRPMRERFPHGSILPLFWHGGWWMCLPLVFILAILVYWHSDEWSTVQLGQASALGIVVSFVLFQFVYTTGTAPEAHVQYGKVTLVGWIFAVLMAYAIAILALAFVWTKGATKLELWSLTVYMTVHVFASTHLILELIAPEDYREHPSKNPFTYIAVIGTFAIFAGATIYRFGL